MPHGLTVRELIMALVLNGDLNDRVSIEVKVGPDADGGVRYKSYDAFRVTRILGPETLVECYEDTPEE